MKIHLKLTHIIILIGLIITTYSVSAYTNEVDQVTKSLKESPKKTLKSAISTNSISSNKGKLTRELATTILKTLPIKNKTSTVHLSDLSLSPRIPEELKVMESRGLATYEYIPAGTVGYGCYGQLTEEGQKYFVEFIGGNNYIIMITAKVGFGEVTGIREISENKTAIVEYTEKIIEVTPIGQMYSNGPQLGQTNPAKAYFVKYDDGWRLSKE